MELIFNSKSGSWDMRTVAEGAGGATGGATLKPPTIIVGEEEAGGGGNGGSEASAAATPKKSPDSKPRRLSRGSSFKTLFSGGTKPPKTTPTSMSPMGSPQRTPPRTPPRRSSAHAEGSSSKQFLQVGNPSSIFRLPKPQVKLLKKTSSVKQLYNSVVHTLKTIARAGHGAGGSDDIAPELTKKFFESILRASDDSPGLVVTKVRVHDGGEFGRHFCSEVHAVEVTAREASTDVERHYQLVVKSQPQSEEARRFLQPSHTFEKEVQMYGRVFHDMASFVRSESVVSLNCCRDSEVIEVPRCFYTRWSSGGTGVDEDRKEDLIILENLYPQGFSFAERQVEGLDLAHSELVIRELAKFHAISFCMKDMGDATILERYPCLREDSLYRPDTEGFTRRTITPVMASLAEILRTDDAYADHYEWFVDLARNFHAIQTEMVRPPQDDAEARFAVICHGDLLLSNILFKYGPRLDDGSRGSPVEVKFIDFQTARFASLATDLVHFLFTSVKAELRRVMLGELISLYYTTFLVSVRSLNVAEEIFSMEELFVEIEEHLIYGFLEGIWYLDILHGGKVPKQHNEEDEEDDGDGVGGGEAGDGDDEDDDVTSADIDETVNEDEREEAEVRRMQRRMHRRDSKKNPEEQKYREDFFELLDEVLFLLGKSSTKSSPSSRRGLRDTSLRFHQRRHSSSYGTKGMEQQQQQPQQQQGDNHVVHARQTAV